MLSILKHGVYIGPEVPIIWGLLQAHKVHTIWVHGPFHPKLLWCPPKGAQKGTQEVWAHGPLDLELLGLRSMAP